MQASGSENGSGIFLTSGGKSDGQGETDSQYDFSTNQVSRLAVRCFRCGMASPRMSHEFAWG